MKWVPFAIIIFLALVIAGLEIFNKVVPWSSKKRRILEVALIIVGLLAFGYKEYSETSQKPSEKQEEETKRKDTEATADVVVARLRDQFPDQFLNPERTNEQKEYIIKGIERAEGGDPNKILEDLIQQVKEKELEIGEDTNNLIQRNKEITIFAQSQGKLEVALDAVNKILKYDPENNFAFRERGFINHRLGNIEQAEKDFLKSIDNSQTKLEKAIVLNGTGIFYLRIGQYKKAEYYLKSSYKIGKEIPNSIIIAASGLNLSNLPRDANAAEDVKLYISEAIIEFEKMGDKKGVAYAQFNLATYYLQHGEIYEAKQRIDKLKQLAEDENDESFKAIVYSNLGNYFATLGDYAAAKEYILSAIELNKKLHFEGSLATDYGDLGIIYDNQGDSVKAEEEYYKALVLHKKLNNLPGKCGTLMSLGNIYVERKKYDEAKQYFDEAMDIAVKICHKGYIAACYGNIGVMYMDQRNFADAESNLNQALPIFEQIGDMEEKAGVLFNLASIYKERGDLKNAIKLWRDSKEIFKQIGLPHMVAKVEYELNKLDKRDTNDTNENTPYTFFAKITKCRIPDGLMFYFDKIIKNKAMTIKADPKASYICFDGGEEITINDFIERVRLYYEKKPPNYRKDVKLADLENTEKRVTQYEINIIFPQKTIFRSTEVDKLLVTAAQGIIEICEENHKFDNYEMFSMDKNTVAKRAWVSKDDMRIGLVLKKNIYQDDKAQIGFQAEGGNITINHDKDYIDPLIEMLKIEIEEIDTGKKQQDGNSL